MCLNYHTQCTECCCYLHSYEVGINNFLSQLLTYLKHTIFCLSREWNIMTTKLHAVVDVMMTKFTSLVMTSIVTELVIGVVTALYCTLVVTGVVTMEVTYCSRTEMKAVVHDNILSEYEKNALASNSHYCTIVFLSVEMCTRQKYTKFCIFITR